MLCRPANIGDVEPVENAAASENQATATKKHLLLAAGQHPTQPRIVDHHASSEEPAVHRDVDEVGHGDVEAAVDDSQPSSKAKLPGSDISRRAGCVETTVDILEGGHLQQDAVGDGNDGNQRVQAPR